MSRSGGHPCRGKRFHAYRALYKVRPVHQPHATHTHTHTHTHARTHARAHTCTHTHIHTHTHTHTHTPYTKHPPHTHTHTHISIITPCLTLTPSPKSVKRMALEWVLQQRFSKGMTVTHLEPLCQYHLTRYLLWRDAQPVGIIEGAFAADALRLCLWPLLSHAHFRPRLPPHMRTRQTPPSEEKRRGCLPTRRKSRAWYVP